MTKITINSNVTVKPGQMRSGCEGVVVAQHSSLEWKVQHSDNAIRIYLTSELEVIQEETEKEIVEPTKKKCNALYSKRFSVRQVLNTLDALAQADKDWVHDLDGRIVRGRHCSSLICDLLWNLQTGLIEQTSTGYRLPKDNHHISSRAWKAYCKLGDMIQNEETGYVRKNFTGKQIYQALTAI